jgi:hypothetical protein
MEILFWGGPRDGEKYNLRYDVGILDEIEHTIDTSNGPTVDGVYKPNRERTKLIWEAVRGTK